VIEHERGHLGIEAEKEVLKDLQVHLTVPWQQTIETEILEGGNLLFGLDVGGVADLTQEAFQLLS